MGNFEKSLRGYERHRQKEQGYFDGRFAPRSERSKKQYKRPNKSKMRNEIQDLMLEDEEDLEFIYKYEPKSVDDTN